MSTIRFLRTFLAVAETGSFAGAADLVALTQAAVGAQMKALDAELKKSLFERAGRGVVLSTEGLALVPHAEALLKQYDEMLRAGGGAARISGTVKIGAIVSAMGLLGRAVVDLKKLHDGLDVKLQVVRSSDLGPAVRAGELDAGILVEHPRQSLHGMQWTRLYEEPFMVVASAQVATAKSDPAAVLRANPFLRFDRKTPTGARIEQALRRNRLVINDFVELNSLADIVQLVRQNAGVTVIPVLKNFGWSHDPELCVLPVPGPTMARRIGFLEHGPRSHITALLRQRLMASLRSPRQGVAKLRN